MIAQRSGLSRVLSASAAVWTRIGITIITQIALVPLYLSSWQADVFGAWLLLQAVWAVINVVDVGHHDYIGYECLRVGTSNRSTITRIVASAAPVALMIATWDILVVWLLIHSDTAADWVGSNGELLQQWRSALLLQACTSLVTASIDGIIVRGIAPFGYYPRVAWWGTVNALMTAVVPGIAVYRGADLWGAALALCATNLVYYAIHFGDMAWIARREGFFAAKPRLIEGLRHGFQSLWLTAKNLAEMLRQQGARLILAPLAGVVDMAAFATMRTGANFALQGLNTITGPLMPELMRFLAERDQSRTDSAFAVVWLVLCAVLCPAVLIVQSVAPALFPIWTHGKIQFDPFLFLMLSLGVLIVALAQPAAAVVQGNNLLRSQLAVSLLGVTVTVAGMFIMVPLLGIKGAALSLLMAETASLTAYLFVASAWLKNNGMRWPMSAFATAALSVVVATLGMAAIALFPQRQMLALTTGMATEALVTVAYWRRLPPVARARAAGLVARFAPQALRSRLIPKDKTHRR